MLFIASTTQSCSLHFSSEYVIFSVSIVASFHFFSFISTTCFLWVSSRASPFLEAFRSSFLVSWSSSSWSPLSGLTWSCRSQSPFLGVQCPYSWVVHDIHSPELFIASIVLSCSLHPQPWVVHCIHNPELFISLQSWVVHHL